MMKNALQAFDFEQAPVRVVMRESVSWFVLSDVCRVLELDNPSYVSERLDDDEKMTIVSNEVCAKTRGGAQKFLVVNESGVYALIFTSRKEVARRFRKWVTSEVLPALRSTGSYSLDEDEERNWPVSADGKLWGMSIAKVNAAARLVSTVSRIYGPEAARALYERETGLPSMRGCSIGEMVGSASDDPTGCISHLLRTATGKGGTIGERLSLAFADKIAAQALKTECGLAAMPRADGGPAVAIANAHDFLRIAYADTQWCGSWREALVDLPGTRMVRQLKAVVVPRATIHKILHPEPTH